MNRTISILFCGCFIATTVLALAQEQRQEPRHPSVFSMLKRGQSIMLTETAGRYEITVLKGIQAGHRILEVESGFIAVEDMSGTTQAVIPIYSVASIKTIKLVAKSH